MPEFLFSNFGQSALSAPLAHDATTMLVSPSDAQRFPTPGADQVFALVLTDGRNEPEIVWVVDNPLTGHLAVQRGREGTPAQNWAVGTVALHTHTKDSLEWFVTGGQILWKNQFQAQLDALNAKIDALAAREDDTTGNQFEFNNYLESRTEQAFATISENWQVVTDFNYALSQITTTLTADVSSNHAEFNQFKTATAGSFGAQATFNTELLASTNQAVATANQSLQATVDNNSAIATAKTDLEAKFGQNSGQITSLQQADVNNYQALSQMINTVSANYGPLSATVTVKAIALADLTGAVGGSFMVDIDANGNFAGFEIVAGDQAGVRVNYAKFTVDKFIIAATTAAPGVNPFLYDAVTGTLYLQNLRIYGNLVVDGTIDTDQLAPQAVTYVNIQYNTIEQSEYTSAHGGFVGGGGQVAEHFASTVGGVVMVEIGLRVQGSGGSIGHWFDVWRDNGGGSEYLGQMGVYSLGGQPHNYAFKRFRDTPAPGTWRYHVRGYQESGGGTYSVSEGYIMTEDKKTSL